MEFTITENSRVTISKEPTDSFVMTTIKASEEKLSPDWTASEAERSEYTDSDRTTEENMESTFFDNKTATSGVAADAVFWDSSESITSGS